ncbi:MAG: exonuclease SbcCD subunit D [bacterium]
MKICHLSDSHLGAGAGHTKRGKSGLTERQEDIVNSFTEAIDKIIAIRPDLCIHSGDLFDAVRPTNRIMAIAGEQLHRLAEIESIPTVIIAGNHDAPRQPHIGAAIDVFRQFDNLYVASGSSRQVFQVRQARILALPHCVTTDVLQNELERCQPDSDAAFNILTAHGIVAGMPRFAMAELGEQEIPLDIINRFDYAALGHFHNYSRVAERACYAGSTERLSQAERAAAKGFAEVDMEPFRITFHEVRCRDMVDLPIIDATGYRGDQLASILQDKITQVDGSDKIVRLRVTGVTEETLKTMPVAVVNDLRHNSFDLNITFERTADDESAVSIGRTAIGRLDTGFIEFLNAVDLTGFDIERLKREAILYLRAPEES